MRWLFATGVSLDISGALLVLWAILSVRPSEVANLVLTFEARSRERKYAYSGASLLVGGFLCQLVGYAWTFSSWWLVGYALGLAAFAFFLARHYARRITPRFYRRANEPMRKAVE